jgi:hypothetical protein
MNNEIINNKTSEKQYSIIQKNHPYKELWKYLTGRRIEISTICNRIDGGRIEGIGLFPEYKIPIGSLINDFIEHKSKSWWKRKWYHKYLTETYVQILNQLGEISYGF